MQFGGLNGWAVLGAIVPTFIIGGLWYSPKLFMWPWLRMTGVAAEQFSRGLPRALLGDLVTSTIMALVLAWVLRSCGATSITEGLTITLCLWLGFTAPLLVGSVTYEHRPLKLFFINAGYRLACMLAMGVILTAWQ